MPLILRLPFLRCSLSLGVSRWVTAACAVWLLAPASLQAQFPRARRGEFEVRGLDFRRDGAWRKRVTAVRTARHRLLRAGAFTTLNLSAPTAAGTQRVTGRVSIPVVPIAFKNVAPPYPTSRYDELFFGAIPSGRPYSLKSFYEQLAAERKLLTIPADAARQSSSVSAASNRPSLLFFRRHRYAAPGVAPREAPAGAAAWHGCAEDVRAGVDRFRQS